MNTPRLNAPNPNLPRRGRQPSTHLPTTVLIGIPIGGVARFLRKLPLIRFVAMRADLTTMHGIRPLGVQAHLLLAIRLRVPSRFAGPGRHAVPGPVKTPGGPGWGGRLPARQMW